MRAAWRWVAAVAAVTILVAVPSVHALEGDGQVQADLPTFAQGETQLSARDGRIVLDGADLDGEIDDGRIRLTHYVFQQRYTVDGPDSVTMVDTDRRTRTWDLDGTAVRFAGSRVTAVLDSPDDVTVTTDDELVPASAVDDRHRSVFFHGSDAETIRPPTIGEPGGVYRTTIDPGQLGIAALRPTVAVDGAVSAYLYNATVRIHPGDATETIDTGSDIYAEGADGRVKHLLPGKPSPGPGAGIDLPLSDVEPGAFLVHETSYVLLQARPSEDATPRLDLDSSSAARLYAGSIDLDVHGTVRFDGATGSLTVRDESFEFEDTRVLVRGDVTLTPASRTATDDRAGYEVEGDVSYVKIGQTAHDFEDDGFVAIAIGLAIGTAGLLAYAWPALKFALFNLVAAPLYTRIKEDEVLGHDIRQAIYDIVTDDPGVSISAIADAAGVGWGTAVYHLGVLEDNDMVVSMRDGRYKRYYRNGGRFNGTKEALAAIRNDTTRDVVEVVLENPGITQTGLCDQLGISAPLAHWHLDRLKEVDVVEQERDGRYKRHYVPDGAQSVLEPHLT